MVRYSVHLDIQTQRTLGYSDTLSVHMDGQTHLVYSNCTHRWSDILSVHTDGQTHLVYTWMVNILNWSTLCFVLGMGREAI